MILEAAEPCLMIGRHTRREMERSLKSSLVVAYELTRWSEHLSEDNRRRLEREEKRKNKIKKTGSRCEKRKLDTTDNTRKQGKKNLETIVSSVKDVPSENYYSEIKEIECIKENIKTIKEIVKKVVNNFKRKNSISELENSRKNTSNLNETL